MPTTTLRAKRRPDTLSSGRIVDTAVVILDELGEAGLTFRVLSERLATGPGAIYWHVPNKSAIMALAADRVVEEVVSSAAGDETPHDTIRSIAVGIFDAIDHHPWVAAQLFRAPWESALLALFERIGQQIEGLGIRNDSRFAAVTALLNYIIGVSGQNAAGALDPDVNREEFVAATSAVWAKLDPERYSFTRSVAEDHRINDKHEVFLAGIDFLLAGILATAT